MDWKEITPCEAFWLSVSDGETRVKENVLGQKERHWSIKKRDMERGKVNSTVAFWRGDQSGPGSFEQSALDAGTGDDRNSASARKTGNNDERDVKGLRKTCSNYASTRESLWTTGEESQQMEYNQPGKGGRTRVTDHASKLEDVSVALLCWRVTFQWSHFNRLNYGLWSKTHKSAFDIGQGHLPETFPKMLRDGTFFQESARKNISVIKL